MAVRDVLKNLMDTMDGREFIYSLLEGSGVEEDSFNVQPQIMAYYAGRQSVGRALLKSIRALDEGHHKEYLMREEARARDKPEKPKDTFFEKFVE